MTDRDGACGCLAVRLARVCWLSLQPTGCTPTLACDVQRYCSLYFLSFNRGGSRNLRKGAVQSIPISLSSPLPFPLKVGPLKPAKGSGKRCKLRQWGPGRSPGRKRIWCTLKLPETHWCKYHVLQ